LNHHSTEKKHFSPKQNENNGLRANNDSHKQNENNGLRANNDSPLPRGTSNTIGAMVRGFKIGVTKWMKQNTTLTDVWQRSFYEHIIKTEKSHENIASYIVENPINWSKDKFYAVGANHHSPEKKHFSPENNHHSPAMNHHSPVNNHHSPEIKK
jgi:hypothetical protein